MSRAVQTRRLKDHVASLETMTRFVLATLALGSGVYTYLGVRSLLDGSATVVFFAAVIYSVSVSVAMYGVWTYLIRFLPEMRDGGSRLSLVGIMVVGSAMIVAMSSWLNAACSPTWACADLNRWIDGQQSRITDRSGLRQGASRYRPAGRSLL